jgi:hypothetical protein
MDESGLEEFFKTMQQGFSGTKKWGSIWISMKRVFEEKEKHKTGKKFRELRKADNKAQIELMKDKPFPILIRTKSKKNKKDSYVVQPDERKQALDGLDKVLLSSISLIDSKKKQALKK